MGILSPPSMGKGPARTRGPTPASRWRAALRTVILRRRWPGHPALKKTGGKRGMKPTFDGLLLLGKPGCLSSRDAADRAQRVFPRRTRLRHTGTLYPLATGVLVL